MQAITPFLWFDDQAEEAAKFYVSVFKNSKINGVSYYPKATEAVSGKKPGSVMTVNFTINGQDFTAINGGTAFKISEAVSFVVPCDDQQELDDLWNKLSAVKESEVCGWLKDKFGVSWQLVPARLLELLCSEDTGKTDRIMTEVLKMKKLDIDTLEQAAAA